MPPHHACLLQASGFLENCANNLRTGNVQSADPKGYLKARQKAVAYDARLQGAPKSAGGKPGTEQAVLFLGASQLYDSYATLYANIKLMLYEAQAAAKERNSHKRANAVSKPNVQTFGDPYPANSSVVQ